MTNDRILTRVTTLGGNDPWAQGQSFMTVEQLQAQIASLTAKIETLETAMLDIEKEATRAWFYWVANECKAQNALDFAEMVLARVSAALQPTEGEG